MSSPSKAGVEGGEQRLTVREGRATERPHKRRFRSKNIRETARARCRLTNS